MTTLPDGRFVFVEDNTHNIFIESKNNPSQFNVLYAGYTVAFAFNTAYDKLAILSPVDELMYESLQLQQKEGYAIKGNSYADKLMMRLRVYRFVSSELTDMIDEITVKNACFLQWVDATHLVLSDNNTCSSIYSFRNGKIRFHIHDRGVHPCAVLERLGLINKSIEKDDDEVAELVFWWLDPDKIDDNYILPHRRTKRGNIRHVIGTCSSGNFVFVANNDASLHGVYVTRGSVRRLKPLLIDIADAKGRSWSSESNKVNITSNAKNVPASETSSVGLPLTIALSSAQVLVGFSNLPYIARYKYIKQNDTLKLLDLVKLNTSAQIIALSRERYLTREVVEKKESNMTPTVRFMYTCRDINLSLNRDNSNNVLQHKHDQHVDHNAKQSDATQQHSGDTNTKSTKTVMQIEQVKINNKKPLNHDRNEKDGEKELPGEVDKSKSSFLTRHVVVNLASPLAINGALVIVFLLLARWTLRKWHHAKS